MTDQDSAAYLAELRQIEDRFYRAVLNSTELYMLGIRLVRAIADSLRPIADLATLIERYRRSGSDTVIPIADALGAPQVVLLDYQLALGAAFYLRSQEIQEEAARADLQSRVAAALAQGECWALIYEHVAQRYGHSFFQRLEMRLADGFSLYTASELDWEKGRVYVLEPLLLDPATGKPCRGAPPEPRQEFATPEALAQAVAALRERYA